MTQTSVVNASLAAVASELLLYGIYLALSFFYTLLIFQRQRASTGASKGPRIMSPVFIGMSGLWLAVTGHCIVGVVRLFLAVRPIEANANLFYSDFSHITELIKYGFFTASVCIGDGLLIHRVWAVWGFNPHIIILPILTLMGITAFGVGLIYQLSQFTSKDDLFTGPFYMWGTGLCVFTHRVVEPLGGSSLVKIMRAFLDSAGLFAAWGLFHLISYQLRSNIQFVAIDGLPAIVGLTNTLILIRLRLDFTAHATQSRGAAARDLELGQSASEAEAESLKVLLISPSA
ncbi:hypothetical protein DFH08DRAFT_1029272 [Mycena albidolilacea]|uniref:Uncharacterized protein n=1 Tax=Mycena albidolilacea TaxID=1033008 RepID=A0AAD6ZIE5_9AGAR|nr:hypothetical protein DFH08DRAFT_1029272 [Mycena albidolilacea]